MALGPVLHDCCGVPRSTLRQMDVVDYAQTAVINFYRGKDQFSGLPSRNLHVQYAQVAVACMSFDLGKAVAGSV